MSIPQPTSTRRFVPFHLLACLVTAYFVCAHTVTVVLDHNEHAYLGVASLLHDTRLYDGVLFNQMPLSVQVYSGLIALTGHSGILLRARILNAVLTLIMFAFVYRASRRLGAGPLLSWLGIAFLTFNPVMMGPMKEAGSYMLALAATWAAVSLALGLMDEERPASWRWGVVGVLLGLSLAAKLYHVAIWPCFLFVALAGPAPMAFSARLLRQALPLSLGCLIGLLPVWVYILRDPQLFWFNNFTYHLYDPLYFGPEGIPLTEKIRYVRQQVGLQGNIAFITTLALACALVWRAWRGGEVPGRFLYAMKTVFLASLILLSTAAAVSPNPVWIQHLAFALPFYVLLFMYLAGMSTTSDRPLLSPVLAATVLIAMAYSGVYMLAAGVKVLRPQSWTTTITRDAGRWIAASVPEGQPVATLSGLYAVEANRPIYPELGMGPFLYRTADHLSPDLRGTLPIASQETVEPLLSSELPGGILVGEEGELDEPFVVFAENHGYSVATHFEPLGLTLYVRP